MDFAEKSRMPVEEKKVKDLLRHQHEFRETIEGQIGTYERLKRDEQFQYGILLYVAEAAHGELKDLMDEVMVRKEFLPFKNYLTIKNEKNNLFMHPGDDMIPYFMNALFTPYDMTDYEEQYTGWNEFAGMAPLSNINWIQRWNDDQPDQWDAMPNLKKMKETRHASTNTLFQEFINEKYTEVDEAEYDVYTDDDEDEDEDYDEEDEEEDDYGDYGDYDEEEEDPYEAANALREAANA